MKSCEKSCTFNMSQTKALFQKVQLRARKMEVTDVDLVLLNAIQTIKIEVNRRSQTPKLGKRKRLIAKTTLLSILILSVLAISLWYCQWHISILKFTKPVLEPFLNNDACVIDLPENYLYIFRPVADCDFCRNVSGIVRVNNISSDDFEERFVKKGQMVLIEDGQFNWESFETMGFDKLKNMYVENDENPLLDQSLSPESRYNIPTACHISRFTTGFKNVNDLVRYSSRELNSTDGNNKWFIGWGNCDNRAQRVLDKKFPLPYFLKNRRQPARYWFHMSSRGHGSPYHIDGVDYIWQAQLQGQKRWFAQPPPECYFQCKSYYMEAVVNPGEVVFAPVSIWFHGTETIGRDFSIAINGQYIP